MLVGGRDFDFHAGSAYVMGILNVTPDSFSDGGSFFDPEKALDHALRMEEEGADLIDIGAESTRPGSRSVSPEEETARLMPVLAKVLPRLKVPVSVDTQKPSVADAALSAGASMINDVSALASEGMAEVVARHGVPAVLMHMKGTPETMQKDPRYGDVTAEILAFLEGRLRFAAERGIGRDKLLIDPGFGFGKRFEDNLELLSRLGDFRSMGRPLVVGMSRKTFLRKVFGEAPEGLAAGGAASVALAVKAGAAVVRVHDIALAKAAIRLASSGRSL